MSKKQFNAYWSMDSFLLGYRRQFPGTGGNFSLRSIHLGFFVLQWTWYGHAEEEE